MISHIFVFKFQRIFGKENISVRFLEILEFKNIINSFRRNIKKKYFATLINTVAK